jgi:uncharacterized protein YigA (DUF484 family)
MGAFMTDFAPTSFPSAGHTGAGDGRTPPPPFGSGANGPDSFDNDMAEFLGEADNFQLLRSFDMIFQLHQRSEAVRRTLGQIDRILLTSRTVPGLVERVASTLEEDLELTAVRLLFREDHPMVSAFDFDVPKSMGIIPQPLMENESLFHSEPYVLDHPAGDLGHSLFGDAADQVASAAVANLCTDKEELGLLCLGSGDPQRYCGGMNMELIASLAEKVSLGLQNTWDHEIRARQALIGELDGVYTEAFLKEYLRKEFNRSWRTFRPFALMALSWGFSYAVGAERVQDLMSLVKANVRGADLVAEGEAVDLWVLLPDTDLDGARTAAQRIVTLAGDGAATAIRVYVGITAFSRDAVTPHKMLSQARQALIDAMESHDGTIAAQPVAMA